VLLVASCLLAMFLTLRPNKPSTELPRARVRQSPRK
jgi:hypothetical protein